MKHDKKEYQDDVPQMVTGQQVRNIINKNAIKQFNKQFKTLGEKSTQEIEKRRERKQIL